MNLAWLLRNWLAVIAATLGLACQAAETLRFEAEDCVVNKDAVLRDKSAPNRWTLWSKDSDAQRKWSGGAVLKSPEVKADRAAPDDGAAPLHLVMNGIPKGVYDLRVKRGRTLAVSMDGREWRRLEGDLVAHDLHIDNGACEFWVDDRFAEEKPEHRGASYLDWIALEPAAALVDGVWNGNFETLCDGQPLAWPLPKPTSNVTVAVAEGKGHSGERGLRITIGAEEDGRCECACRKELPVTPGESYCLSVWAKGHLEGAASVMVDGFSSGRLVKRRLGQAVIDDAADWTRFVGYFRAPDEVTEVRLSIRASAKADLLVDDVGLAAGETPQPQGAPVHGWAKTRVQEKLNRGVVALRCKQGAYVSWRLLDSDPPQVGFMVYRGVDGAEPKAITSAPITQTCDLFDRDPPKDGTIVYRVVPQGEVAPAGEATLAPAVEGTPHIKIRMREPDLVANRVAVGDLDGDGALDFVVKHPNQSIDPYVLYWKPSATTYKLDAYTGRGQFLWRRDLGWSIETGVWYSPYIVCDLDGDSRAEVIAKTGEGDPRDASGRVGAGPEWLSVIDGRTGRDLCRTAWPSRKGFDSYNLASRNQLAVAYLDGKTPCLLALRGTYSRMKVDAYQMLGGKLEKLWRYDNAAYPTSFWGQGAHATRVADVDGDGRDEILLGSVCLDDNGAGLWTTGRGHPDGAHLGDLLPRRPGLEVFYCVESAQAVDGGLCMVDAATGKQLWALAGPTRHVHSGGMCSDLDPTLPGCECYGADTDEKKRSNRGWLYSADGALLGTGVRYGTTAPTVFWDADLQREIFRGRIFKHGGGVLEARPESGKVVDLLGDWREEIISSVPGELRIYSTTLPAMDRRVCLLQDPVYRACVTMSSMGYETPPTVSTPPAAAGPNLNLTFLPDKGACRVVVSAGPREGLSGELALRADGPFRLATERLAIKLKAGGLIVRTVEMQGLPSGKPVSGRILGELKTQRNTLRGETWVELPGMPAPVAALVEAEAVGENRLSQGNQKGQFLEWSVEAPSAGRWDLLMRYHAPEKASRRLILNGKEVGVIRFLATRGEGDKRADWDEVTFADEEGKPFALKRGPQTIRLENIDGSELDLDYLGFSRGR